MTDISEKTRQQPPRRVLYISIDLPPDQIGAEMRSMKFADLSETSLAEFAPDLVVCQLFTANLDATMVLEQLDASGYTGECYVLSQPLPRPKLVEAELRSSAGKIQVKLITSI